MNAPHGYEERVRASFARQSAMATLGCRLTLVNPGIACIEFKHRVGLAQQHGFIHAGILAAAADSACGYAAMTLMPIDTAVLTVEFKINLIAPAVGERFVAKAIVVRAGRTITVCHADVFAYAEDHEKCVAIMQSTVMAAANRQEITD